MLNKPLTLLPQHFAGHQGAVNHPGTVEVRKAPLQRGLPSIDNTAANGRRIPPNNDESCGRVYTCQPVKRGQVVGGFVTPNARTLFSRVLTKDVFRRSIESASLLHELGAIESVSLWSAIPELPISRPIAFSFQEPRTVVSA